MPRPHGPARPARLRRIAPELRFPDDPLPDGGRRRELAASGCRLHVVEAGPPDGRPVVLLHGFPEFWWSWRRQIPALAAAGYRVVAPDLRGYHRSSKPRGVGAYRIDRLAGDLRALLDDLGPAPHAVVAHDWGAAHAFYAALVFPERFAGLAILNGPHPLAFRRALFHDPAQRRRSRYVFWFQLPWIPERKLLEDGARRLRAMFRRTSRPGTFSDAELDRYAAAAAIPGAMTSMLHWYRAALRRRAPAPPGGGVVPPVRILWGIDDAALGEPLLDATASRCRDVEVFRLAGAGHWVQHEAPDRVNELLLDFLAALPVRSGR